MNNYEGQLVALEGIDGSGTSTLAKNLEEWGLDAVITKEPSDGQYGEFARMMLSEESEPSTADFFAFLADRADHCKNVIEPALKDGETVVTDRYDLSTFAYQSKVIDEEMGLIEPFRYIDELTAPFTISPDLYIYLDISVDEALERIDEGEEKYETRETLEEAKRVYDYFYDTRDNVYKFPGTQHPDWLLNATLNKMGFNPKIYQS